jgi:hypothetical protein
MRKPALGFLLTNHGEKRAPEFGQKRSFAAQPQVSVKQSNCHVSQRLGGQRKSACLGVVVVSEHIASLIQNVERRESSPPNELP